MIVTVKGRKFGIEPDDMTLGDGVKIESVFGDTIDAWGEAVQKGSLRASQAMVLVLVQKQDPTVRLADVEAVKLSELLRVNGEEPVTQEQVPTVHPTPKASAKR